MLSLLKLLLVAAFLNALSWIILIPIWQYPDEQAHFAQVQDLAELGKVPTGVPDTSYEIALSEKILGTERDNLGNNKYTYHPEYKPDYSTGFYGPFEKEISLLPKSARREFVKNEATLNPPLYYLLASIFYRIFYDADLFTRVFAVRIMSAFIFLGTIFVAFGIGKLIFEQNKILPPTLAALVAFKPMLVFASTGILPDPLTNLLFTIIIYLCSLVIVNGVNYKYVLLLIGMVIAGLYTRQQFLLSTPIIFLILAYDRLRAKRNVKLLIIPIVFLIVFIIISNYQSNVYFFNSLHIPELLLFELGKFLKPDFFEYLIAAMKKSYAETWPWYWGVYRWLSFTPPHFAYEIINRLVLISLIGLLFKIFQTIRSRKFDQHFIILLFMIISTLIYFSAFIIWDYFFMKHKGYSFGFQGRYFFPLIIAHLAILLYGIVTVVKLIGEKYLGLVLTLLVTAMILFNNLSLFHVAASYYDTSNVDSFIIQASQYKPNLIKGQSMIVAILSSLIAQGLFLFYLFKHVFAYKKD
ncbi:hypothetical protein A3D81_01295 [Candidatus Curtissbacteria bacterium RIFCSPHIGHO2_02_FULL_40_17]|uniref:Glycosyltransferase RgtA/B/C/D-like domain-containing protein n=4 Tax=Candidatus Curtissiibacteriota TaxID=1752717 RepID=A0A1F5GHS7_9BACT|nr:MAG: hypothetical protein A2693_00535 [Candidatus Curtissbacteria bacterium RIFCSPHIGHO2_01_FULL_40_12]OGD91416.1 MAG: hypothetical protein A3D81_01295 [Candidatus Curtissbacteria bacterium RIFCSPHIGHO2_02_FULL_40_17]OGE04072.1 MAG: hypothetical protein A3F45_02980 [Candidatus Curtissbacteria bacterium RIFCSPHIGHO2_12_FULL_41_17]OGE08625.1 MAG: hypothetical protein A3I53_02550 [Candidatus Curtissbacteria bacterium RIFCSPLOWO2_02_FULL_40_13b]